MALENRFHSDARPHQVPAIMAFEGMTQIDGITVYSDPTRPGSSGTISFLHERIDSNDLAMLLNEGDSLEDRPALCTAPHGCARRGFDEPDIPLAV